MGQCNKSLTVADTIMASNKRPIIGKPFMVIFFDITEIIGACCFSNKPKSHRKNEEGQVKKHMIWMNKSATRVSANSTAFLKHSHYIDQDLGISGSLDPAKIVPTPVSFVRLHLCMRP